MRVERSWSAWELENTQKEVRVVSEMKEKCDAHSILLGLHFSEHIPSDGDSTSVVTSKHRIVRAALSAEQHTARRSLSRMLVVFVSSSLTMVRSVICWERTTPRGGKGRRGPSPPADAASMGPPHLFDETKWAPGENFRISSLLMS